MSNPIHLSFFSLHKAVCCFSIDKVKKHLTTPLKMLSPQKHMQTSKIVDKAGGWGVGLGQAIPLSLWQAVSSVL